MFTVNGLTNVKNQIILRSTPESMYNHPHKKKKNLSFIQTTTPSCYRYNVKKQWHGTTLEYSKSSKLLLLLYEYLEVLVNDCNCK